MGVPAPLSPDPGGFSTRWAARVDTLNPLPEYPRPSLTRKEWKSLNGLWSFSIARESGEIDREGQILVPFPVESSLSGQAVPIGPADTMRYRRSFSIPETWKALRVLLHFCAVDYESEAWVNGARLGIHRGGFVPFHFDITECLRDGAQELVVEARDPTDTGTQCRGKQSQHPGGIWYTASSGIWGSVWIECVPAARIERVVAMAAPGSSASDGRLSIRVGLSLPPGDDSTHRLSIRAKIEGSVIAETSVLLEAKAGSTALVELAIPNPRPWFPENPFLYGLSIDLDGIDHVESYAALRTLTLRQDKAGRSRVFLNGEPYFINAVLDQGYWPEGVYTAPTDEALVSDIEAAKTLGFNAIRKHTKVESERWYWHCDRLGILVWQDIPSGGLPMRFFYSAILGFLGFRLSDRHRLSRFGRSDAEGRSDFEREAAEIVEYLSGFPCVVAWTAFNEGWGQFDSVRIAKRIAELDPSRLVDAASGWYDRGGGHFASRHDYSKRPRAPKGKGRRAAALSEFGGLTMRVAGHSTADERQFGYAGAKDAGDLATQYEALAERLSSLAQKGLAASVYTQITDVEIERNGLLTYDREIVKADAGRVRAANLALSAAGGGFIPAK